MGSYKNTYQVAKEAHRLLRKGEYGSSAGLLERTVAAGAVHHYIYFMLAVAYLYDNSFFNADRMMGKIAAIDANYMPYVQLKAFLAMKSAAGYESALKVYSDLSARHPGDRLIAKARMMIIGAGNFEEFQKKSRLADFVEVPKPPAAMKRRMDRKVKLHIERDRVAGSLRGRRVLPYCAALLVSAVLIVLLAVLLKRYLVSPAGDEHEAQEIDMISLDGSGYDLISRGKDERSEYTYHASRKVIEDFDWAKSLIKKGRYNESLRILNRIFHGNVNIGVREKTDFLIRWISHVEVREYEEVPFKEISEKPGFFRGFSLRWQGRVANMVTRQKTVSFTLMVNYGDKDTFEGVAEVFYDGTDGIRNGSMVSVDGVLTSVMGAENRIYLVAREVRKL